MKVNIKPKELNTLIEHLYQYLDENDNREDLRDILIKLEISLNYKKLNEFQLK